MRVGIDLTALLPAATGVDRYLLGLLTGLAALPAGEDRFILFVNREDRFRLPALAPSVVVRVTATRHRSARLSAQQLALPCLTRLWRLDVLHSPSFILPLAERRAAQVLTIHDMTSFSHPDVHDALRSSRAYRAAVRMSIRLADRICVPSQAVGREVTAWTEVDANRVRVVPHGIAEGFAPQAAARAPELRRQLGLRRPYVLAVGTLQPRKNLELLLEAYARLVGSGELEEDLVLAGSPGWGCAGLLQRARAPDLDGRVRLLGYVPDEDLPSLMAGARALVYPSLQEGFGFPPLEGMACGVPVVASDVAAHVENLDGAAVLVPVRSEAALADALLGVLRDDQLRARLRSSGLEHARRFTWARAARTTVDVYAEAAASHR